MSYSSNSLCQTSVANLAEQAKAAGLTAKASSLDLTDSLDPTRLSGALFVYSRVRANSSHYGKRWCNLSLGGRRRGRFG